jgi:hypothetical protein
MGVCARARAHVAGFEHIVNKSTWKLAAEITPDAPPLAPGVEVRFSTNESVMRCPSVTLDIE